MLEEAPRPPPFSHMAVCKEPYQQTWSPRRPGQPWPQEKPAESSKEGHGQMLSPSAGNRDVPNTQHFTVKAPVPSRPRPDPGEGHRRVPRAHRGRRVTGSETPGPYQALEKGRRRLRQATFSDTRPRSEWAPARPCGLTAPSPQGTTASSVASPGLH